MARFDDCTNQPRHTNAVATHLRGHRLAIRALHRHAECLGAGVFVTEEEDMTHLDTAPLGEAFGRDWAIDDLLMLLGFHRIDGGQPFNGVRRIKCDFLQCIVIENLALTGFSQNVEFMAKITANRPGRRANWHRLQPKRSKSPEIGSEHGAVGGAGPVLVQVEAIGVLHQEFAPAHYAKPRPGLVPEFPLDVIEGARQITVAADGIAENDGDHLLVGRAVQHVTAMPVLDPQHLRAIGIIAPGIPPQIGRLDGRHQHLDCTSPVLLGADNRFNLAQYPEANRQPGVNAGGGLADEAGPQHQLVADNLGLGRGFPGHGQEISGHAHGAAV